MFQFPLLSHTRFLTIKAEAGHLMLRSFSRIPFRIAHRAPERKSSALQIFRISFPFPNMAKRKRSTVADASLSATDAPAIDRSKMRRSEVPLPSNAVGDAPKATRRQSSRGETAATTNPDLNPDVLDGVTALRASPDAETHVDVHASNGVVKDVDLATEATSEMAPTISKSKQRKAGAIQVKVEPEESTIGAVNGAAKNIKSSGIDGDPEDGEELEDDEVEIKEALSRPPPVNSEYLPLPWKGRLGYVCICCEFHANLTDSCTRLV
jgi:UV DNA damage endonuclease